MSKGKCVDFIKKCVVTSSTKLCQSWSMCLSNLKLLKWRRVKKLKLIEYDIKSAPNFCLNVISVCPKCGNSICFWVITCFHDMAFICSNSGLSIKLLSRLIYTLLKHAVSTSHLRSNMQDYYTQWKKRHTITETNTLMSFRMEWEGSQKIPVRMVCAPSKVQ